MTSGLVNTLSHDFEETGVTVRCRPSHKRVISIQSASTDATLGEDGDATCSETDFSDTLPRTEAVTGVLVSSDLATTIVKNTFVEMAMPRPFEWDGCFEMRGVQSAPGSVLVFPPAESDVIRPQDEPERGGFHSEQGDQDGKTSCSPNQTLIATTPKPSRWAQSFWTDFTSVTDTFPVSAARPTVVTLRLAEILEPAVGLAAVTSIGSAGHGSESCKPCAFFWKESGCQSGISCQFCHVCDPSEKKRRRKAKLQFRRIRSQQKTKEVQ